MTLRSSSVLYLLQVFLLTSLLCFAPPAVAQQKSPQVNLPKRKNSFVERAEMNYDPTGFKIRGIKGWSWTPEQYLEEIPILAKYKMNLLMNCYLSMFSQPLPADSLWKPANLKNEWWLPIPEAKKKAYSRVFARAREYGVAFCFGIHAQLATTRPADLSSEKDFEDIWQHYSWAQNQGVHWFSVPLDDVSEKNTRIGGTEHAKFVNKLLTRLRKKDKTAQMIFCPTYYHANLKNDKERTYLEELAKTLDKDVYVFWTGNSVVPATINTTDAEAFKKAVGHRLIIWDNYPCNDAWKTMHLGPLTGRDKTLPAVVDGYLSNPPFQQNEINRIPLFTIANYAYDAANYDPDVALGEAIIHQADDTARQQALLKLTQLYTSPINRNLAFSPVVDNAKRLAGSPDELKTYVADLKKLEQDLARLFPNNYASARKTLALNIAQIEKTYIKK